jgi:RHS repeat-associated protein
VFLYDADDERIMTFDCAFVDGDCAVPAQLTTKIRGLDGKVLRIYNQPFGGTWNWERDYVYRDGQLLASVEPTAGGGEDTVHFHLDHLGSPRQITDEAGAQAAFHTYYPFGGEATDASQDDVELKFTGHERDENGGGAGVLDYMHRRYFSPTLGRFLAVDPADGASLNRPQGWNRLAYSMNNPLRFIDPDGREEEEPKSTFGKLLVDIQKALDTYVGFNFLGPVDYRDGKFRQVLPTKTEAAALLGAAVAITIVQRSALSVDAEKALSEIESGADRPNVRNPNSFENDGRGGSEVLPTTDSEGNPIRYTEYTVNPREPGQALDGKRFVIGDDGSIYYTEDHFEHFHKLEDDTVEIE